MGQRGGGVENIAQIDFKKIFLEKLETIEPVPDEYREDQASGFESLGIKRLKREVPALVFLLPTENTGEFRLWITDPKNVRSKFMPHEDVEQELANFLEISTSSSKFPRYPTGGFLLQDESGLLCLILDKIRSERVDRIMDETRWWENERIPFLDMLQSYGISRVAGTFSKETRIETPEGGATEYSTDNRILIDKDIIGERREDLALLEVAKKYKMTNTQFMRFRILAKSSSDSFKRGEFKGLPNMRLRDVEEIAKEVIAEDRE
ncbi:MAG TPA: hypothetical protein VJB95_00120 [Candidatus Paceibacterota bacterium]